MTAGGGTALIAVDLQSDFSAGFPGDPTALDRVTTNAARAVDAARHGGTEVVFVRFVGDVEHQRPSWRRRDELLGKRPKCREGSSGAEFHKVAPAPGERVFTKRACFDAFLSDGFERHLSERGVGHLVFVGLFTDVCVDSTARTAFQKGFHVTVLTDCTASLHLPDAEILRFMRLVYGARTTTLTPEEAAAWATSTAIPFPAASPAAPPTPARGSARASRAASA
ncbi:cysteine hydrolase family protein [Streptomyces radicis]|uniref:Cysteine hydrolase n=1 Tax=Streptomyces radicis TaxID=1750517 RepID=A0A3A9WC38_9ACTN|nr:cysteine hydrolase [Streptomyces radicis]RKN10212.1 cysteine hydrolase [Streptomyces radicis]RKN24554.1 cysteine hydrolase [Streptomyces radicis]